MRDISYVLELWAGWARAGDSSINYSSIAAGFKGLLPQTSKMDLTCSDDDGLLIDSCIAQLKKRRPEEYDLLLQFYLCNISKRRIAKKIKCDEKLVRIKIKMAEGFIDGCLSSMNIKLECE